MTALRLDFKIRGLRETQRQIEKAGRLGQLANRRALNETGRKATVQTARELAAEKGVPVRPVRRRVKHFINRELGADFVLRVWVGLKARLKLSDVGKRAAKALRGKTFTVTLRSGKRLQVVREVPGKRWTKDRPRTSSKNLPIKEPEIDLMPEARTVLLDAAREHFERTYPAAFKRDLEARVKRSFKSK